MSGVDAESSQPDPASRPPSLFLPQRVRFNLGASAVDGRPTACLAAADVNRPPGPSRAKRPVSPSIRDLENHLGAGSRADVETPWGLCGCASSTSRTDAASPIGQADGQHGIEAGRGVPLQPRGVATAGRWAGPVVADRNPSKSIPSRPRPIRRRCSCSSAAACSRDRWPSLAQGVREPGFQPGKRLRDIWRVRQPCTSCPFDGALWNWRPRRVQAARGFGLAVRYARSAPPMTVPSPSMIKVGIATQSSAWCGRVRPLRAGDPARSEVNESNSTC